VEEVPEYKFIPKYDPRHKEFKLTPEQLTRYRAGEKLEDILNEGNAPAEAPQQIEVPKEEGENEVGKAKVIGMSKYRELEERYENLKHELDKQLKTTKPNKEYETLLRQKDAAIVELRKELLELRSQKSEQPRPLAGLAEIENLKAEMQHSQELFNEAMIAKENADKEVLILRNKVSRLEDTLEEKTTLFEDLRERNRDLLKEIHPLRILALLKLKREVE
jgi:hypothetical protein